MADDKNCLKIVVPCIVLCGHSQMEADFGLFGMKDGSKHVQLHIQWTIWIHERVMVRSFSNKSFLDQSHASKPVLNLSCIVLCGHSQIQALMGN